MFILFASKIKAEKLLLIISRLFWFLFFPVGAFWLLYVSWTSWGVSENWMSKQGKSSLENYYTFPLEKIGEGALSLHRIEEGSFLSVFSKEIFLVARNHRPTSQNSLVDCLFSLKNGEERFAKKNEKIFLRALSCSAQEIPKYTFSEEETDFWIRPTSFTSEGIRLFVCANEGTSFEKRGEIFLKENLKGFKNKLDSSFLEEIKKSKLWGQDVLLARFGSGVYASLKEKVKLEILNGGKSAFFFVSNGDFLYWQKGLGWAPLPFLEEGEGHPIARIRNLTSRSLEIEVWDSQGFFPNVVKVELQKTGLSSRETLGSRGKVVRAKGNDLPNSVRLRSPKQVSCSFGKKRYFLKEGDWILKTTRGWKNLKTKVDVANYIQHDLRGQLFVFDALVQESGNLMMKGFLVDEMRTSMVPFSLPVSGESRASSSRKIEKKPPSFSKDKRAFTKYVPPKDKQESEDENEIGMLDE